MKSKLKKYERVGTMMIRPLLARQEHSAFDLAQLFYAQYSNLSFEDDLIEYMRYGYVVTRPNLFAMVRPILHEGERIWFIRIIIGNLAEAISCMPCWLPKVAYCRNNQAHKMVVVDTERAIELSMKLNEKNGLKTNGSGIDRGVASGVHGGDEDEGSFDGETKETVGRTNGAVTGG